LKYLLDTCVISEMVSPRPNKQVTDWIAGTDEKKLFVSVLTVGEIYKGINKLSE